LLVAPAGSPAAAAPRFPDLFLGSVYRGRNTEICLGDSEVSRVGGFNRWRFC